MNDIVDDIKFLTRKLKRLKRLDESVLFSEESFEELESYEADDVTESVAELIYCLESVQIKAAGKICSACGGSGRSR